MSSLIVAHDVVQIVKLGEFYQVKYLSNLTMGGFEESIDFGLNDWLSSVRPFPKQKVNDHKLSNNISRALTNCRNIALSNKWDYFITLTLDPKKYDRYDLDKFHKDVTAFFKRLNRKYNISIRFLLVPERHKNGAWHMHGLISGLCDSLLSVNDNSYIEFSEYSKLFGYASLAPVVSKVAVSFYITKHLGKQLYNGEFRFGSHLYYCSRGLSRGEIIATLRRSDLPDDFIFQYSSKDGTYKSSFFENDTFLKSINLL